MTNSAKTAAPLSILFAMPGLPRLLNLPPTSRTKGSAHRFAALDWQRLTPWPARTGRA